MSSSEVQPVMDFYRYPAIGVEDWRYGFSTAKVRVLESMMLTRGTLADMASASTFEMALELRQQLRLTQQLVMTPQLQQAIKLLQLSRLELLDVISEEMVENPFRTGALNSKPQSCKGLGSLLISSKRNTIHKN